MSILSVLDVFYSVDAFWRQFEPLWEREQVVVGKRHPCLLGCVRFWSDGCVVLSWVDQHMKESPYGQ